MKTNIFKGLTCTMILVYVCIFLTGRFTFQRDMIPQTKDTQLLKITQVEMKQDNEWIPIELPSYIDVNGTEILRVKLNYEFTSTTIPSFIMQANHSFMDIYLDNHIIYHVEPQSYSLGNYFTNVSLPFMAKDRNLEIHIQVPEKGLQRIQLSQIQIVEESVFIKNQFSQDLPSIIINCLIFIMGLAMLMVALSNRKSSNFYKLLIHGITSLNLAFYFMCETLSVIYFINQSQLIYYFDMLTFSLIGVSIVLLFSCQLEEKQRKYLNYVAWIGIINTLVQLVLGISGILEFRIMLKWTHFHMILCAMVILYSLIRNFNKSKETKYFKLFFAIIIGGLFDLFIFIAELNNTHNVFFLRIGIFIYMIQQIYVFIRKFITQIEADTRENYYKHLAFRDFLTGCHSRIAYELDKNELDAACIHTIYSFDVNDLKKANDFFGHDEGDKLLHSFGSLIIKTFDEFGKCYRIGGDEFLVICESLPLDAQNELIECFSTEVANYNLDSDLKNPITYGVGMCSTLETEGNLEKAIFSSDERMYENKRQHKAKPPILIQ